MDVRMHDSTIGYKMDISESWQTNGNGIIHDQLEHSNSNLLLQQQDIKRQRQQQRQQERQEQRRREQQYNNDWQIDSQTMEQQQQFEHNVQTMFGLGENGGLSTGGGSLGYDPFANNNPEYSHDVNTSAFLTALRLNLVVFVVLIGSYELFRKWFPTVYSPKSAEVVFKGKGKNTMMGSSSSSSLTPPSSRSSATNNSSTESASAPSSARPAVNINTKVPLGWIPGVIRASWSAVRSTGGLDSYMFLRYVRLCFRITFTSALWGMIILWPVYASGDGGAAGWYFLSMANITQGSERLWAPTIFIWLQTLYVLFLMNQEYAHYLECRVDFLARGDGMVTSQQHMYSLIVERIPYELRSDRALYDYFHRLFPRKIYSTAVVLNLPDLERESQKRKRVLRRLEKSMVSLEVRGRRPRHVVGRKRLRCCGIETAPIFSSFGGKSPSIDSDDMSVHSERLPRRGENVDSINYYSRELSIMNDRVARLQHEKIELAQKGNDTVRASQWISHAIDRVSSAAESTLRPSQDDGLITGFNLSSTRRKPLLLFILDRMGIDFISGAINLVQQNIDEVVDSVVGATMSSTGFITFNDLSTLACALKTPLYHKPDVLVVKMAPEHRDIIWENAHVNLGWRRGREWTANVLLGLGALLWSIPVASIQALATADQIAHVPGLAWIATFNGGEIAAFVNGYLPVVLLLVIILILPHIFYGIALHYEDRKTESDVQASIIGRYFYYQLANIFITVTAGSILDSIGEIIEHPSNMLSILGKSLPNVVGYFATFIMTKMLAGLPMILLRFGPLMRMVFIKTCFREKYMTQAEKDEAYYPEVFSQLWYGWDYPNLLLVITICFVYSCISPIILPVGAAFFLCSWLLYKNQILLVFSPSYESGGTMFPMACHRTLIGMVCGQLTLIGYTLLREGFYQALIMFPLPLVTVKMMDVFNSLYVIPGMCISIEKAVELDAKNNLRGAFSHDFYRQPVLAEPHFAEPEITRGSFDRAVVQLSNRSTRDIVDDVQISDSGRIV